MGYEIYITRASDVFETSESPILEDEWKSIASVDSDLAYSKDDWYERKNDDGLVERHHPWILRNHPNRQPLWFMDGAIHTTNPDEDAIKKMFVLANRLSAVVLGEEGETYGSDGKQMVDKPNLSAVSGNSAKKPWWRFW